MNFFIKTSIISIVILTFSCDRTKYCFKDFYNYNSPLIQEIDVAFVSANNQNNSGSNFVELYLDSISFYSKYSKPIINFNQNSVLVFQECIEQKSKHYISGFLFELREDSQSFTFVINVCSNKVLRNKKTRSPIEGKYILTNKLQNKPIKTIVNYDN